MFFIGHNVPARLPLLCRRRLGTQGEQTHGGDERQEYCPQELHRNLFFQKKYFRLFPSTLSMKTNYALLFKVGFQSLLLLAVPAQN